MSGLVVDGLDEDSRTLVFCQWNVLCISRGSRFLMRPVALITMFLLVIMRASSASADPPAGASAFAGVTFAVRAAAARPAKAFIIPPLSFDRLAQSSPPRPVAIEYSDGYRLRAKIHWYASLATLPLFGAEGFVGQSLYKNPTEAKKTAHLAIATGIGTLFGINAVTGIWNLVESRKDPNGRTRRTVHAVLMLAASGGFFATAATAPESEHGEREGGNISGGAASTHRAIAFTSIGLASASYLIMLFTR